MQAVCPHGNLCTVAGSAGEDLVSLRLAGKLVTGYSYPYIEASLMCIRFQERMYEFQIM